MYLIDSIFDELCPDKVIILLPHYDDEFCMLSVIKIISRKFKISFVYLTQDRNLKTHQLRKRYSTTLLNKICYLNPDFYHLSELYEIEDQNLINKLDIAFNFISHKIATSKMIILTTAFESGHPDHDAAFILALKLLGENSRTCLFSFPVYSKSNKKFPPFRVMEEFWFYKNKNVYIYYLHKFTLFEGIKYFGWTFKYPKQKFTFIGLCFGTFYRFVVRQSVVIIRGNYYSKIPPEASLQKVRYKINLDHFFNKIESFL